METSSKATADTLTALKTTTEIMNDALQKQLALYYDVSLNVYFNLDSKKLELTNMGRTNISLWALGSQFLHEEPSIVTNGGRTVVTGTQFSIEASGTYTLIRARYPVGFATLVPFEIYLKNERREEFVAHCDFVVTWDKDTMKLGTQTVSITPEHWPRRFRKTH